MVGLIKKVFGGAKSDFYAELDESQTPEPEAKKPDPEPVETPPPPKTDEAKAPEPAKEPAEVKAPEAQTPSPKKSKTSKKKSAQPQAATPAPAPASQSPEDLIAAAVNGSQVSSSSATADDKTFAPNYLMPVPTKSRRRPGPSLKMFQAMARQVNGRKG